MEKLSESCTRQGVDVTLAPGMEWWENPTRDAVLALSQRLSWVMLDQSTTGAVMGHYFCGVCCKFGLVTTSSRRVLAQVITMGYDLNEFQVELLFADDSNSAPHSAIVSHDEIGLSRSLSSIMRERHEIGDIAPLPYDHPECPSCAGGLAPLYILGLDSECTFRPLPCLRGLPGSRLEPGESPASSTAVEPPAKQ